MTTSRIGTNSGVVDDVDVEHGDEPLGRAGDHLADRVARGEPEPTRPTDDGPVRLAGPVHRPYYRERAVGELPVGEHHHQRDQQRYVPPRDREGHSLRLPDVRGVRLGPDPQHRVEDEDVTEAVGAVILQHVQGGVVGADEGLVEVDAEVGSILRPEFELRRHREGNGGSQQGEEKEEHVGEGGIMACRGRNHDQ
ncbi:hypothetical protein MUK42_23744 [Musa troglodytarum]|uniref:Uncharacterized protein n=1 Tax=Musa troglodytarum TaxID=320322 RepID=A0A9E7G8H0_9LILI|nr:hypothetical protein MUK42_23744 [Musa troglodytarum]